MRRALWILGLATALAAGALFVGLRRLEHRTVWRLVGAPNYGEEPGAEAPVHESVNASLRIAVGPPAATLDVWVQSPDHTPTGTVLVLHGVYDKKRTMVGFGRMLRNQVGLRSVLVDLRGHGHSSGNFLSFGALDSADLRRLLDALDEQGLLVAPVSIYGPSYGASVALQTAASDARITKVVAVAGFASFERIVLPYIDHFHPQLAWALPDAWSHRVLEKASRLAGVDIGAVDNVLAIAKTEANVLLMHGERDEIIGVDQARALYDACGPERCKLVVFPDKNHAESMSGDTLNRETIQWLRGN